MFARTVRIVRAIGPFVVSFLRDRRRWIVIGRPITRSPEFHQRRADRLVHEIGVLGPSFVKLAQVFAGRADLIPAPYITSLGTLTDRVPPITVDLVEREIAAAYGKPAAELFERFDVVPIAAASLGQVHRAKYQGREVVVKVLRPGVESLVAEDLRVARRLLAIVERWWTNPHLRALRAVVEEFSMRVGEEMDFRKEAANAEQIRANFARHRRVVVPRIEADLVRQRVLVMEYLEGTRIDALDSLVGAGRVRSREVVATVMELYIQMMLIDGLFHADPHPGNLLVAPDGRLIVLDFGMVVPVPRDTRWHLISTVFAAIRQDVDGVLAGFSGLGIVEPGADLSVFRELARTLLAIAHTPTTAPERLQLVADEVMETLYDWPVTLPRDMVYFARAAALIEGLGVHYDRKFNAITFAAPIALRMRRSILDSLRDGPPVPGANDWAYAVGGVLGHVAGLMTKAGRQLVALMEAEFSAARVSERERSRRSSIG
jgi:predicted unusual protein kinase regulating ubiquinone biosynthesis (AarF/ABC1/UbiB family)